MQRNMLKEDVLATTEEANEGEVAGLRRHAEVHNVNVNDVTIEETLLWARSARVIKRRVTKSMSKDARNMMNARVN